MVSAPQNPVYGKTVKAATELLVRLGPDGGDPPAEEDVADWLIPMSIRHSAGGDKPAEALFEVDLGSTGDRLVDLALLVGWNAVVEIFKLTESGTEVPVFWGELTSQSLQLSESGERDILVASIERYHFGETIRGPEVRNHLGVTFFAETDLVFNPEIDGIIEFNRSSILEEPEDDATVRWIWIDPESIRTDEARKTQTPDAPDEESVEEPFVTGQEWTIGQAAHSLMKLCNSDEEFIDNVTVDQSDVNSIINIRSVFVDAPALRNLRIARGTFLPQALDRLLLPHGFNWHLSPVVKEGQTNIKPVIRLFRRNEGTKKQIWTQRPGEVLSLTESNSQEWTVEQSIVDIANKFIGYGSIQEREITIELYRGWPRDEDSLTADELNLKSAQYNSHPNAWRKWVANEAGDYTGTRTEPNGDPADVAPITGPLDLSGVFITGIIADWTYKRRKFGDLLTLKEDGTRRQPMLEYWDPATEEWVEIAEGDADTTNYTDEMTVYFSGNIPPRFLRDAGDDARLRITATVTGDKALKVELDKTADSPNQQVVEAAYDLSDRFHDRKVQTTGPYASSLAGSGAPTDEADDAEALEEYLEKVSEIDKSAAVSARVPLFGMHFDYKIGDLVTRINGRNINLNANSPDSETKRYPQIIEIVHNPQNQERGTVLTLGLL